MPGTRSRSRLVALPCLALLMLAFGPCAAALGAAGAQSTPAGAQAAGGAVAPATGAQGVTTTTTGAATTLPAAASGTPTTTTAPPIASETTSSSGQPVSGGFTRSTATLPATHTPARAGSGKSGVSGAAILAAVIAGLIALACLLWGIFRFAAFEPHWLLSWRHSLAEAGFRASATWAEFTDWFRLGH